jgi:hypothetical protein
MRKISDYTPKQQRIISLTSGILIGAALTFTILKIAKKLK